MKPTLRQLLVACDSFTVNGSEEHNTWDEDGAESFDLDLGGPVAATIALDQKVTFTKGYALAKSSRAPVMFGFFKNNIREMSSRDVTAILSADTGEEPQEG